MRTRTLVLAALLGLASRATATELAPQREAAWRRWLIPLPKEVRIEGEVELPPSGISVRLRANATDVEKAGAERIRELLPGGAASADTASFEILIGAAAPDAGPADLPATEAARLAQLPNSEQAYRIRPDGEKRLILTATDPRGVYYACCTLRQLLEGSIRGGTIRVPLANVTDWPDLAERGEWGGSANRDIPWLAAHKMNLVESHVSLQVTEDGKCIGTVDPGRLEAARLAAVKFVPILTHLDQLDRTGVYRVYPSLRGRGETARRAGSKEIVAPCLSQPKMIEVLTGWMDSLADSTGVTDICAWLSEFPLQCGCEECRKVGQHVLEARAIVRAWQAARRRHPRLGLRILLTQGSYASNDKVLAEIPEDVGVTYYDGGRTYDSSKEPMIYPLLEAFAAKGRWLGCYPQLTASWRIVCPWSGPQFIRYRMQEFVDKKLRCLCGYATPDNRFYAFNVMAAAEWSWNARGRSEREFAAAWATRRRIADADRAADWAVRIGRVGWDVYGSQIPYPWFWKMGDTLSRHQAIPLGAGMLRYFPTVEHMDQDLRTCEAALRIAEDLREPDLILETKVIQSYVQMAKALYEISQDLSRAASPDETTRAHLADAFRRWTAAASQNVNSLKQWEQTVAPGLGGSRFPDTIRMTEDVTRALSKTLEPLGVHATTRP